MIKKLATFSVLFVALGLAVSPAATARTVYYAIVCDASFNTIAKSAGYPACSDMIREEFVKKGIKFVNDNTNADTGGVTYYLSGSWSSPSAGSNSVAFLQSLDDYSGFEEQSQWHFKLGFTGKRMSNSAGGSYNHWKGFSRANNAVISYYETDGNVNSNWMTTALHELTHMLRRDGFHHEMDDSSDIRYCAMDIDDYGQYSTGNAKVLEICSY